MGKRTVVTGFHAEYDGVEYGFKDGEIYPEALVHQIDLLEGREVYTSFGKPVLVDRTDAEAVLDVCAELFGAVAKEGWMTTSTVEIDDPDFDDTVQIVY